MPRFSDEEKDIAELTKRFRKETRDFSKSFSARLSKNYRSSPSVTVAEKLTQSEALELFAGKLGFLEGASQEEIEEFVSNIGAISGPGPLDKNVPTHAPGMDAIEVPLGFGLPLK